MVSIFFRIIMSYFSWSQRLNQPMKRAVHDRQDTEDVNRNYNRFTSSPSVCHNYIIYVLFHTCHRWSCWKCVARWVPNLNKLTLSVLSSTTIAFKLQSTLEKTNGDREWKMGTGESGNFSSRTFTLPVNVVMNTIIIKEAISIEEITFLDIR